jgi:hypothetical protein
MALGAPWQTIPLTPKKPTLFGNQFSPGAIPNFDVVEEYCDCCRRLRARGADFATLVLMASPHR